MRPGLGLLVALALALVLPAAGAGPAFTKIDGIGGTRQDMNALAEKTFAPAGYAVLTWNMKRKTSAERFGWMYSRDELAEWVEPLRRLAASTDAVYGVFDDNAQDYAPRSAAILRDLLDEAGIPATGGVEPEPAMPTLF